MDNILDIFGDDAFSIVSLTNAISNIDHVPGQAGSLTFAGNGQGVPTTKVALEYKSQTLSLIPTSPRGAPAPQETRDKASIFDLEIPHIVLQETISAASIQNVRAFGSNALLAAQQVTNEQTSR